MNQVVLVMFRSFFFGPKYKFKIVNFGPFKPCVNPVQEIFKFVVSYWLCVCSVYIHAFAFQLSQRNKLRNMNQVVLVMFRSFFFFGPNYKFEIVNFGKCILSCIDMDTTVFWLKHG